MDPTNSNCSTAVALEPQKLIYEVTGTANPTGTPATNWIRSNSHIRLEMEALLPLHGSASDFSFSDTSEVDIFPLDDDIEEIVSLTLRLVLDNGFPINGYAQVYFLDTTGTVILDSIFADARTQVLTSGEVANEVVDQTNGRTRTLTDIVIDREKLEKLESNGFGNVVSRAWLETSQMGAITVKILQNYSMNIFLGLDVEAKVKTEI